MKGSEDHDCGRYRYWSWRAWDADKPTLGWVLLRPTDNPRSTLCKVIHWSYRRGYGSVSVCYVFAARAGHFHLLMAMSDPVGPECDDVIFSRMGEVDRFVCAWTDSALNRRRSIRLTVDPRWESIRDKAYAVKLSGKYQPYFGFGKMGGMVPYSTPRVSDGLSESRWGAV